MTESLKKILRRGETAFSKPSIWMLVFLIVFHVTFLEPTEIMISRTNLHVPLHENPLVIEVSPSQIQGTIVPSSLTRDVVQWGSQWLPSPFRSAYVLELNYRADDARPSIRVLGMNSSLPSTFVIDIIIAIFDKNQGNADTFNALNQGKFEDLSDLSSLSGFLDLMIPMSFNYNLDQGTGGTFLPFSSSSDELLVPSGTDLVVWVGLRLQPSQDPLPDSFPQKFSLELSSLEVVIDFPTYVMSTYINFMFVITIFILLFYVLVKFLALPILNERSSRVAKMNAKIRMTFQKFPSKLPQWIRKRLASWRLGFKELSDNYLLPIVVFFGVYFLFISALSAPVIITKLALKKGTWNLEGISSSAMTSQLGAFDDKLTLMTLVYNLILIQLVILALFILPVMMRVFQRSLRQSEIRDVIFSLPLTPLEYHHTLQKQTEGVILLAFIIPSVIGALMGAFLSAYSLESIKSLLDEGSRITMEGILPSLLMFTLMILLLESLFVGSLLSWNRLVMAIQQHVILNKPRLQPYLFILSIVISVGSFLLLIGLNNVVTQGNVRSWEATSLNLAVISNFSLVFLPGGASLTFWNLVTRSQPFSIIDETIIPLSGTTITIISIVIKAMITGVIALMMVKIINSVERFLFSSKSIAR